MGTTVSCSIAGGHGKSAPTLVTPLGVQQILYTPNVNTARNKNDKRALKCTQAVSLHGCLLCTEHRVSFHHGQTNHKSLRHTVCGFSWRASTSTHSARTAFTSTRERMLQICLFSFQWRFLCTEHPSFLLTDMHSTKGTHK